MFAFSPREVGPRQSGGPLRFAVHGLGSADANALRRIMAMLLGRSQREWQAVAAADAEVLILGPEAEAEVALAARCIVRVAAHDSVQSGDVTRLEYPFRVFQVLSALAEVEAKLDSGTAGSVHQAARNRSWALFDDLRLLASDSRHDQWHGVRYDDGRELYVRGDLQEFAAVASVHASLAAGQLPQDQLSRCAAPLAPDLLRGSGRTLLWQVGLHSGRGQLSSTLDAALAYRLQAWPDFGVLRPQPLHLRLGALLGSAAWSRDALLERLGPEADVVRVNRFLNACAAAGLLHAERREPLAVEPPARPPRAAGGFVSGLVASIRQRLGLAR